MPTQVVGLGGAGMAAAQLLLAQGQSVIALDEHHSPSLQQRQAQLQALGATVELNTPLRIRPATERVIVSPGIAWDHPSLQEARAAGIPVIGEAELAWQHLQHLPWIGVTGTNGKTTTTALIAAMFGAAGKQAPACGNIGLPLCQVALNALQTGQDPDWIIAELSSYQLEASSTLASGTQAPRIGVWTTFTPDHLERHRTLDKYAAIKASLLDRATQRVINGEDPYLWQRRQDWPQTLWTNAGQPTAPVHLQAGWIWAEQKPLIRLGEVARCLPGRHNLQNILMATAACYLAGLDPTAIAQAIERFPGVPHRLETVRQLGRIRFINDSKATNYDAALVGLTAIEAPVILIAGGKAKQGEDQGWLERIRQQVSAVFLIGEAAPQFADRLRQIHYTNYQVVETLDRAVPQAFQFAQTLLASQDPVGVTILFSPACASYDQYANFEQRGDHFRTCCQSLELA